MSVLSLPTLVQRIQATTTGLDKVSTDFESMGQKVNSKATSIASKLTRTLSLPMAGLAAASVDMASKYQSAMLMLQTQAGASAAEVKRMSSAVLAMAGQVGQTPTALADALFHIESAGIHGAKALQVLKTASEGAAVGGANLTDVQQALAFAVVSGISGVKNMQGAMGTLNAIVGSGDMHMQDLAEALGSHGLLATSKIFGLSLKDVGAALALFGDNGMRGSMAANQLRMAMFKIGAPSQASVKAFQTLGLSGDQLAKDMRKPNGLLVAMKDLRAHLNTPISGGAFPGGLKAAETQLKKYGLTTQEVDKMVGKLGPNATEQATILARAFGGGQTSGAVLLMLTQLSRLQSKYADLSKGASKFGQDWALTQQTFKFKMNQMKASAEAFGIQLGTAILPIAQRILGVFQTVFSWVMKLPSGVKKFGEMAVVALAVAAPLFLAIRKGVETAEKLGKALHTAFSAAQKVANKVLGNSPGKTSGPVAEAESAAGGGASSAGPLDTAAEALSGAAADLSAAATELGGGGAGGKAAGLEKDLVAPGSPASEAMPVEVMGKDGSVLGGGAETAASTVAGAGVAEGAGAAAGGAEELASSGGLLAGLANPLTLVAGAVVAIGIAAYEAYKHFKPFRQVVDAVGRALKTGFLAAVHGAISAFDALKTFFTHTLPHWFDNFVSFLKQWGPVVGVVLGGVLLGPFGAAFAVVVDLIVRNWGTIKKAFDVGLKAIETVLKPAWDAIKAVTKVAWDAIKLYLTTWWTLVEGVFKAAIAVIEPILKTAWTVITSAVKVAWDGIKTVFKTVWDLIAGIFKTAKDTIYGIFKTMLDLLTGKWGAAWDTIKSTVGKVWGDIEGTISTLFTNIVNGIEGFAGDVLTAAEKIGKAIIDGIVNAITGAGHAVLGAVKGVLSKIPGAGLLKHVPVIGGLFGESGGVVPAAAGPGINPLPRYANGGTVGSGGVTRGPTVIVGEGNPLTPEYVIPTDPAHRNRAIGLMLDLSGKLGGGLPKMASGGTLGSSASTALRYQADIVAAQTSSQAAQQRYQAENQKSDALYQSEMARYSAELARYGSTYQGEVARTEAEIARYEQRSQTARTAKERATAANEAAKARARLGTYQQHYEAEVARVHNEQTAAGERVYGKAVKYQDTLKKALSGYSAKVTKYQGLLTQLGVNPSQMSGLAAGLSSGTLSLSSMESLLTGSGSSAASASDTSGATSSSSAGSTPDLSGLTTQMTALSSVSSALQQAMASLVTGEGNATTATGALTNGLGSMTVAIQKGAVEVKVLTQDLTDVSKIAAEAGQQITVALERMLVEAENLVKVA